MLLDLMLPGADGIEVMRGILDMADLPVIFLSGYGRDQIIARAFEMGALRKRAAPDRTGPREPFLLGDLAVDYEERRVTVAGRTVPLTDKEYQLLCELSVNAGRVLTHDQLLRSVWSLERSGDPRLVRAMVKKLRNKLGDDADNPAYIFTEPRVGYRVAKAEGPGAEEQDG